MGFAVQTEHSARTRGRVRQTSSGASGGQLSLYASAIFVVDSLAALSFNLFKIGISVPNKCLVK